MNPFFASAKSCLFAIGMFARASCWIAMVYGVGGFPLGLKCCGFWAASGEMISAVRMAITCDFMAVLSSTNWLFSWGVLGSDPSPDFRHDWVNMGPKLLQTAAQVIQSRLAGRRSQQAILRTLAVACE